MEHVARLEIKGPDFAALTKQALVAEYGGEIDNLLTGLGQSTLENPEKLAAELFKTFGTGVTPYYVTIIKFAESGLFHPEEDSELEKEEEDLASLIHLMEPNSSNGEGTDSQT